MQRASLLATALASLAAALVNLDLPTLSPGIDWGRVERDMEAALPEIESTSTPYQTGWIPEACHSMAVNYNLNPADFSVFVVHYPDCDNPWTMCRHKDAAASEDDMRRTVGRLPVHMRSYLRHLISTPGLNDGAAAFASSAGDIVFEAVPDLHYLTHEMSHILDWRGRNASTEGAFDTLSGQPVWQDSYSRSRASVSDYSRANWLENLAEVGILGVYDTVVPGGVAALTDLSADISLQYGTYRDYMGQFVQPGGVCQNRFSDSEPIAIPGSTNTSAKFRMKMSTKPDTSFSSSVTVIEPKPELEGKVAYCDFQRKAGHKH